MAEINRHNYEIFFIDYLDGNLSPLLEKRLWSFLKENPDLKDELENFEPVEISSEKQPFPEKQQLKKSILLDKNQCSIFDEICIRYVEGDLSLKEKVALNEYMNNNSEKSREFKIFKQTKIEADTSILFPNKEKLKKSAMVFALKRLYPYIAVAASILLLIAVYLLVPQKNSEPYSDRIPVFETNPAQENFKILELTEETASTNISPPLAKVEKHPLSIKKKEDQSIQSADDIDKERFRVNAIDPLPIKPIEQKRTLLNLASVESGITNKTLDYFHAQYNQEPGYKRLTSFLAESVSERLINTPENKNKKFELFDLARWSVKGFNWLTGSNMTLEKQYNKDGEAEKINFNSKLIAFSAPIHKK
ncbi:MAG TPA: hypothetical protein VK982_10285 [Bacteroidales bacterium]|nr:hypothetical protein [Bacteroidales bacterium]